MEPMLDQSIAFFDVALLVMDTHRPIPTLFQPSRGVQHVARFLFGTRKVQQQQQQQQQWRQQPFPSVVHDGDGH
jgi:hypothetical protein